MDLLLLLLLSSSSCLGVKRPVELYLHSSNTSSWRGDQLSIIIIIIIIIITCRKVWKYNTVPSFTEWSYYAYV